MKVTLLSEQVDRVTARLRSSSVPDLSSEGSRIVRDIVDQLLTSIVSQGECNMAKTRQCHHCHRPTDHPEHSGIGSGVNHCTLDHYDLCPGGRKTSSDWTGCPATTTDTEEQTNEFASDQTGLLSGRSSVESLAKTPTNVWNEEKPGDEDHTGKSDLMLDPEALRASILEAAAKADRVVLDHEDGSSDSDEEDKILQMEVAKLRLQVEQDEARLRAEKKEKKLLNRLRLEKEKAELLQKAKTQRKFATPPPPPIDRSLEQPASNHLHREAVNLAARQQKQAADRQRSNTRTDQMTIGGIRSLPGSSTEVERLLAELQAIAPSLARAPTAPSASGPTFQPAGVYPGQMTAGDGYDTEFVFNPGRGTYVQVVRSPARENDGVHQHSGKAGGVRLNPHTDGSDDEVSADEDCPMEPPPGYQFVWKRDAYGEKYFTQKVVKDRSSPEMVQTYVCDEATGRWYKRTIPKSDIAKSSSVPVIAKKLKQAGTKTTPVYKDHRLGNSSPVTFMRRGVRTPTSSAPPLVGDRLPGIVPIDSERQGRDSKVPDNIQWARNCPVNWTTKVTSANINVVLWAWAYVAELLATRTGMSPNLESGELEARLQHFCHVLEIALQTSGMNDFGGDSWAVARLYDRKVQQKVDSRMFSWVELAAMNHGASMPHELIAATQELAKKPKEPRDKKGGDGKGKGGFKEKESSLRCPTWNKSETRGKCTWEVENAPKKCYRAHSHECNWCKSKSLTPVNHQRFFCRKRIDEEGG